MNQPLVSILIPVYNREKYIGECIESALAQTYTNIEVVVVDNASTDRTWEICQKFALRDARVRVFKNSDNIGPVRNWQRCFEEAEGKFSKLLFSDDLIRPEFLDKTLPYLENKKIGFVFTSIEMAEVPNKGMLIHRGENNSRKISSNQYLKSALTSQIIPVSPGCAIFRTEDLRKNLLLEIPSPTLSGFSNHGAGPDFLLYLLTAANYQFVYFVSEQLSFFRIHSESISTSNSEDNLKGCYLQARLWFAEKYCSRHLLTRVLVRSWLAWMLRKKQFFSFSEFSQKYVSSPPVLTTTRLAVNVLHEIILRLCRIKSCC